MKSYSVFSGTLPDENVRVVTEGTLTRLYFDFSTETRTDEEENETQSMVCEVVDTHDSSYGGIVDAIIRDRYSAADVEALTANYVMAVDDTSSLTDAKRAEYKKEYAAFQTWRARAKEVAAYASSSR